MLKVEAVEWKWRYLLLFFDCFIAFGCFFNVDVPSALQTELQSAQGQNCMNGLSNLTCCPECLGLGPDRYNQLYAVFSWMNALVVLPVGFLLDRLGNRITAIFATLTACLGSSLFALATTPPFRMTSAMFPLMMTGRILLGAGNGACQLVQDRVIAFWFYDKLGLAFGVIVSVVRCGSVLNFLLTSNIATSHSVAASTWFGSGMCFVGFLASIGYCIMETIGRRAIDSEHFFSVKSQEMKVSDIRKFPCSYWLVITMISTYYSCFIPYVANGSKFIQDKYGYSRVSSSYINGAIYDVSLGACFITGLLLDRFGGRAISATTGAMLTLPVYPILMYMEIHPLILTTWLGVMYSITVISLWPSVARVIPIHQVGTANGIAAGLQGLNIGLTNLGIGKILGAVEESRHENRLKRWRLALSVLLCQLFVCCLCGIILNINEKFKNGRLNKRFKDSNHIKDEKEPLLNNNFPEYDKLSYQTVDATYSIQD